MRGLGLNEDLQPFSCAEVALTAVARAPSRVLQIDTGTIRQEELDDVRSSVFCGEQAVMAIHDSAAVSAAGLRRHPVSLVDDAPIPINLNGPCFRIEGQSVLEPQPLDAGIAAWA